MTPLLLYREHAPPLIMCTSSLKRTRAFQNCTRAAPIAHALVDAVYINDGSGYIGLITSNTGNSPSNGTPWGWSSTGPLGQQDPRGRVGIAAAKRSALCAGRLYKSARNHPAEQLISPGETQQYADNKVLMGEAAGLGSADLSKIDVRGVAIKDAVYDYEARWKGQAPV